MESKFSSRALAIWLVATLFMAGFTVVVVAADTRLPKIGVAAPILPRVPTPKEYLGYNIGDDYKLTPWEKIVGYMKAIDESSMRVEVYEVGKSTQGRPMIITVITSESNWARMKKYRDIIDKLSDPRKTTPEEAMSLAQLGKPIYFIDCNIHSPEVGSAEMSMELAYKLASSMEPEVREVLDNLIIIINPSINPDGHDMVTEWYYKYLPTPYDRTTPPYYHEYVNHDNNRDWVSLTQAETNVIRQVVLDWKPTVMIDLHEAGKMLYVSPGPDPTYSEVDPIIQAGWIMFAGWIMEQMTAQGFKGVNSFCYADMWFPGYTHEFGTFHNAIGYFFETAAGQKGTPVYVTTPYRWGSSAVSAGVTEKPSWNNPDPFPGGWWTLRDDVIYQETGVWLSMQLMARFPEKFLYNYYTIAQKAVTKGKTQPYAYLVPPDQKDPFATANMLNTLLAQGVEVHKAEKGFAVGGAPYPAGTYIIRMDQPYRAIAKSVLEVQSYPLVDTPTGLVMKTPYTDPVGWTFKYCYGVNTVEVNDPAIFEVPIKPIRPELRVEGKVVGGPARYAYLVERVGSVTAEVLNTLFKDGYIAYESDKEFASLGKTFKAGTLIIPVKPNVDTEMAKLAKELGITAYAVDEKPNVNVHMLQRPRMGIYEPWSTATSEVGWTRFELDRFGFVYEKIYNKDIVDTNLRERFDIIVIAEISPTTIVTGPSVASYPDPPDYIKYRGIGTAGVANLKKFVEEGGTLITLGGACSLPITYFTDFKTKVTTVPSASGWGTMVKMLLDNTNPIAYCYDTWTPMMYTTGPVFQVTEGAIVGWYPEEAALLLSGYLRYPERLPGYAALVDVPLGEGNVVLYGFKPVYRGMTEGTFMLVFNAIYNSAAVPATLP